jgi:hypothetical protein
VYWTPKFVDSDFSGARSGLPPARTWRWPVPLSLALAPGRPKRSGSGMLKDDGDRLRQVELGERGGAEALAPGGAERELLGDGLPAQAEARHGGVADALVGKVLEAAGEVELEGVEAGQALRRRGHRHGSLDVGGGHAAVAPGERHRRPLVEQLHLGALIAEGLLAPLGTDRHGDGPAGRW